MRASTLVDVDMTEEAALDAEAGFPIALYETVTDLNAYLAEHGSGFDYAGLVAKCASPDVKGILQSLVGAGAIPEDAYRKALAAARRAARHLSPSFPRIRRRRHHLSDHAGAGGEDRRRRDLHAQRRGACRPSRPSSAIPAPAASAAFPGISLPAGMTAAGLPVGIEFVWAGRRAIISCSPSRRRSSLCCPNCRRRRSVGYDPLGK